MLWGRVFRQQERSVKGEGVELPPKEKECMPVRKKPEKLPWNFSQNRVKNSLAFTKVICEKEKRVVVRKWDSSFVPKGPRLDLSVTDNVFSFLAMLQQVPRGLGTKGLEALLSKPDAQGRACNVLTSLHEECKKKLQQNEDADSRKKISGREVLSCRISRGILSRTLEWPNHKHVRSQASGNSLNALHFPRDGNDASYSHLDILTPRDIRFFSRWRHREVHPQGRWGRTLLSSLAGAAGLKMLSPKLHWLLLELAALPWLRHPEDKEATERTSFLGRRWWHLPVKVAMAVSSRFCGSLSNSFIAAHILLLVLELRGKQQELPVSNLVMVKDQEDGARCRSCTKAYQGAYEFSFVKGDAKFLAGQRQEHLKNILKDQLRGMSCETCVVNAYTEALRAEVDDLPWDWTEEIVQLIASAQTRDSTERKTKGPSKEELLQLTDIFHKTFSPPIASRQLTTEPSLALEEGSSLEYEERSSFEGETPDCSNVQHQRAANGRCGSRGYLRHSKSDGSLNCAYPSRRQILEASGSSVAPLSVCCNQDERGDAVHGRDDAPYGSRSFNERSYCSVSPRQQDMDVSISFVSEEFPHGIELVFPLSNSDQDRNLEAGHTAGLLNQREEATAGLTAGEIDKPATLDQDDLSAPKMDGAEPVSSSGQQYAQAPTGFVAWQRLQDQMVLRSTESDVEVQMGTDTRPLDNSALVKSILTDNHKTSQNSAYASDFEGSEYYFEACSMSLPDLDCSTEQLYRELDSLQQSHSNLEQASSGVVNRTQSISAEWPVEETTDQVHTSIPNYLDSNNNASVTTSSSWSDNRNKKFACKTNSCDEQYAYDEQSSCEETPGLLVPIPSVESTDLRSSFAEAANTVEEEQACSQAAPQSGCNNCNSGTDATKLGSVEASVDTQREELLAQAIVEVDTSFQEHPGPQSKKVPGLVDVCCSNMAATEAPTSSEQDNKRADGSQCGIAWPFAEHPICVGLRKRRHEYGDQKYLSLDKLQAAPWRELVFWHGQCHQGNPTLCVLLGKAVQKLPAADVGTITSIIISHIEYAEINLYKGTAKQLNLVIDLWGLGLMRMPPMDILQHVGQILNRDYAGRGASVFLVNAPVMLSLVMGAIRRVILSPAYNKGAMIEKGFLESKDRIHLLNRQYKPVLEKHFERDMLPCVLGGRCACQTSPERCTVGIQYLANVHMLNSPQRVT